MEATAIVRNKVSQIHHTAMVMFSQEQLRFHVKLSGRSYNGAVALGTASAFCMSEEFRAHEQWVLAWTSALGARVFEYTLKRAICKYRLPHVE
jgi:hypothetical protein